MNCQRIFRRTSVWALALCFSLWAMAAHADQPPKPTTSVQIIRRLVPLNDINPTYVAWMFAPSLQNPYLENPQLQKAPAFLQSPFPPVIMPPWYQLPRGIQSIKPNDSKKTVELVGTDSAVTKLQDILRLLDHPLRLVKIETRLLEVNENELKLLLHQEKIISLSHGSYLADKPVMIVNSAINPILSRLIWERRAVPSYSRTFLTYRGAPAQSAFFPPAPRLAHMWMQRNSDFLVTELGRESFLFTAWPTVKEDDTLNLNMVFNRVALRRIPRHFQSDDFFTRTGKALDTSRLGSFKISSDFKDGETAAFLHLIPRPRNYDFHQVLFVTPRLVSLN